MIKLDHVTKSFANNKAVDDISFSLEEGTITGFVGPNGAGKTTTLRMICGITQQDEGDIYIEGTNTKDNPTGVKYSFGYVPDNPEFFTALTGLEYIKFICDIYKVDPAIREARMEELAADFEMERALGQKISSYSHGMQQKIHLIAALMHDPDIWILDEPMTGLDPQSSYLLKQRMRKHADKGNAVLFSTHVLEVAEKLCDQIVIINEGKIVYTGSLEDLKARYPDLSLEEIFLTVTGSRVMEEAGDE